MNTSKQTQNEASMSDSAIISDTDFRSETTTYRNIGGITRITIALLVFSLAFLLAGSLANMNSSNALALAAICGLLAFFSIRVAAEWDCLVILRLGKFHRVATSGLTFVIPFVDVVASKIDMRVHSTPFFAEHVLTSDLVPVNVDAVLFWGIHDAQKASTEIRNFDRSVVWSAQTTLRDVMGSISLTELSKARNDMDIEIARILEEKTEDWGISVISIEIRDINIPQELQDALSAEARARQEAHARLILTDTEIQVASKYAEAAKTLTAQNGAMELRAMNALVNVISEKGGAIVVPSKLVDAVTAVETLTESQKQQTK